MVRWLPQSSKLLYTVRNGVGGFDSHPLSPELSIVSINRKPIKKVFRKMSTTNHIHNLEFSDIKLTSLASCAG